MPWYHLAMQDSDRQHVGEIIREFCAVHRQPFNTIVAKAYWEALKDLSLTQFDAASSHLRKHSEWMPRPAHFRKALQVGWI